MVVVKKTQFVIFFDLRKYAQIDQSQPQEKTYEYLNSLHAVIYSGLEAVNASVFRVLADTSTFVVDPVHSELLPRVLSATKSKVDAYFCSCGFDSKLSAFITFGVGYWGSIICGYNSYINLNGPVANQMQKLLSTCDNTGEIATWSEIIFDKFAADQITCDNGRFKEICQDDMDLWLLLNPEKQTQST